jgi:hypothetical protein
MKNVLFSVCFMEIQRSLKGRGLNQLPMSSFWDRERLRRLCGGPLHTRKQAGNWNGPCDFPRRQSLGGFCKWIGALRKCVPPITAIKFVNEDNQVKKL